MRQTRQRQDETQGRLGERFRILCTHDGLIRRLQAHARRIFDNARHALTERSQDHEFVFFVCMAPTKIAGEALSTMPHRYAPGDLERGEQGLRQRRNDGRWLQGGAAGEQGQGGAQETAHYLVLNLCTVPVNAS